VQLRSFDNEIVWAARRATAGVLSDVAGRSDIARRVHESCVGFRDRTAPWSRISLKAVLEAREGVGPPLRQAQHPFPKG
jgi:TRAP-type mannitol/chloroaromatic compound transport system substrate-binding protein